MKTHKLKTLPEPFEASWNGIKSYEVRKNDRIYEVGDEVILMEYIPDTDEFSGRKLDGSIIHITHGGQYGLDKDYVVFELNIIPF